MFVNKYVRTAKPYKVVTHKAWELSNTKEILKLDWNEATIQPSPRVFDELKRFIENGNLNWYPDVENKQLVSALADYNQIPQENVQYFASSDSLHEYLLRAFLEPEDKIVIVSPTYDNFRAVAESGGATLVYYFLNEPNYELDKDDFILFLDKESPKVVYLCNPNNPTGTVYSREVIDHFVRSKPNTLFIIDEAYYEFTGITLKDSVLGHENLVVTRTFSKAFALAGFRIGYILAHKNNIAVLNKIRNPKNISSLTQVAAVGALQDLDYMKGYVEEVLLAKRQFVEKLNNANLSGVNILSGGGNFILLRMKVSIVSEFVAKLEERNIFVRSYRHVMGMGGGVRITIGTRSQMEIVADAILNIFGDYAE